MLKASRTQSTVSLSSAEAELISLSSACAEGVFVTSMLMGLHIRAVSSDAYTERMACLGLAYRRGLGRVRHLAVRELWVQALIRARRLRFHYVTTQDNIADISRKGLPVEPLEWLRRRVCLDRLAPAQLEEQVGGCGENCYC